MNLTKTLRSELVNAVLKDQFENTVNGLQKKLSEQISKELLEQDNGFSREILMLVRKHGKHNGVSVQQRAQISHVFTHKGMLFGDYVDINFSLVRHDRPYYHSGNWSNEVSAIINEASALFNEIRKLDRHLCAVLDSVRTVAKLQEITKVFDPFIPKAPVKSTQLVPTESLLLINELKTPKAG